MATVDNVWYVDYGNGSSTGYYAATAWAALTTKVCGALVRQAAAPSVNNERIFVCVASTSGTGATGASEPTWTVTRGAKNTDGTVTWQEATGIAALNGDLTNTPNWNIVKNTAVSLGQVITNVAGNLILICTTAGTAGNGSEPSWASFTNAGATTADNTATWTTLGASFSAWAAPHARLANAWNQNWASLDNTTVYVASEHAETQSSNISNLGTKFTVGYTVCVAKTHVPPQSGDVTTGATVSATGASNIVFGANDSSFNYFEGISFTAGSGSSNGLITFANGTNQNLTLQNCSLALGGTGAGGKIRCTGSGAGRSGKMILDNTTVSFAATDQTIAGGADSSTSQEYTFIWRNTPSAVIGSAVPTNLFDVSPPQLIFVEGVDLSALGSGKTLVPSVNAVILMAAQFKDVKLGASVTISAQQTSSPQARTTLIRGDSGATNNRTEAYDYQGTQTTETTIIRTNGASDGVTGLSWKLASSANAIWPSPFLSLPIMIWNDTTATNVTVTIEGLQDPRISTSLPNNDQIWASVEYLGSGATPLGSFASGTKANILASGSALTASTQAWDTQATARQNSHAYNIGDMYKSSNNAGRVFVVTTAGTSAGSEPGGIASAVDGGAVTDGTAVVTAAVRFKQAVTLSAPQPGMKGYLQATIKVGKASASGYYIDPLLTLS